MQITNKLNLPASFVNYVNNDDHPVVPNRYSCTEILGSVREVILNRRYHDKISVDVADMVPALFGTAVHQILENNTPVLETGLETECSVENEFGELTLSGRIDLLNINDKSIEDYKTCSTTKVIKKDFQDWYHQGMEYAYLVWLRRGIICRKLKFYALMKDWSKIKASIGGEYPASPIYVWECNIEDSEYIFEKLSSS